MTANNGETPEKRYCSSKLEVSNMRTFDCLAFIHVPKQNGKKLESKTYEGLMMEYDSYSEAYHIFDLVKRKIVMMRDVVFNEQKLELDHIDTTSILNKLVFPNIELEHSVDIPNL